MNERQLATILAALRYWQRFGGDFNTPEHDIASNMYEFDPLSHEEIDALCEQLNTYELPIPPATSRRKARPHQR